MCIEYMYGTVVPNDFEEFKKYCIDNNVECVIVPNNKVLIRFAPHTRDFSRE